jgi:small redox-active disulfide protein 2
VSPIFADEFSQLAKYHDFGILCRMVKTIKVLGTDCCDKCSRLYDTTVEAVRQTGIDAEVSKVADISEIIALGVMTTPAIVVNGQTVVAGRIPSLDEIKQLICS